MATINTSKGKFHFRNRVLYLGSKRIDKEKALENLKLIVEIMNKQGIKWGPIFGSVLGIIRDNDFITWDEDIDCYILKEDEEKLKNALWAMKDAGFELVRYLRRGLYSVMRNGEYIDFYVLRPISKELRHTGGRDFVFEKYLQDTIEWDFKSVKLTIPREYEEYLEFTYGDWRTPHQVLNFEDRGLKFIKHWLRMYIKDYVLPDFLYYRLLLRFHKQHLEEFKAKCKRKGVNIPDDIDLGSY